MSFAQFMSLAPLGFFAAAAHAGAVFAMSAGAVSFGQACQPRPSPFPLTPLSVSIVCILTAAGL
jgi:hypothetical protein